MKYFTNIMMLAALVGCGHFHNQPIVSEKGEHYISPDQKIDVEILVEKSNRHNPQSYVGRIKLKSGTNIPTHIHKAQDEYLYFEKGGGVMTINGKDYTIKDGTAIYVPMGMKHSYKNTSENSAKAIQFYTPGGPEQRFKEWE